MGEMLQDLVDCGETRLLYLGGDRGIVVVIIIIIIIAAWASGMKAPRRLGVGLTAGVDHHWRDGNGWRSCEGKIERIRMIQTRQRRWIWSHLHTLSETQQVLAVQLAFSFKFFYFLIDDSYLSLEIFS